MDQNRQEKIFNFYEKEKRMPTYVEMMKLFGFKSKNSVYKLVEKMIEAGVVRKDHLGRLLPTEDVGGLKRLGLVTAGLPAPVEEEMSDTINLNDFLVGERKDQTFILEVDGDSMIEAHIEDGDMVVAERRKEARDGEIVIAYVDGEFTMKYFKKKGTKAWLEPANKKYYPIYPTENLEIVAVVKGVIRKY